MRKDRLGICKICQLTKTRNVVVQVGHVCIRCLNSKYICYIELADGTKEFFKFDNFPAAFDMYLGFNNVVIGKYYPIEINIQR